MLFRSFDGSGAWAADWTERAYPQKALPPFPLIFWVVGVPVDCEPEPAVVGDPATVVGVVPVDDLDEEPHAVAPIASSTSTTVTFRPNI